MRAFGFDGTGDAQGVTLLELLVVMTIIGLMLAVVPPIVSGVLPGLEHEGAARELAAALRQARSRAITRNEPSDLYLDVEAKQYWTSTDPQPVELPPGLQLELYGAAELAPDETSGGIRFYPDGSSTGGQIVLSWDAQSYRVNVDWLLGKVQIDD